MLPVGPDLPQQRERLVVIVALGVHLELDAADDVGRSHASVDTERHICVADFMLVIGEIADRLGRFEELFSLRRRPAVVASSQGFVRVLTLGPPGASGVAVCAASRIARCRHAALL
jgi:hypothetical protein